MKRYKWALILVNLLLLLGYFNYSIAKKETILADGKLILLALAPVDPRSLMQGDYMTLQYQIANDINERDFPKKGYCVLKVDSNNVATKIRVQKDMTPIHAGEYLIKYTSDNILINIGAESYFFQEGKAQRYEEAQYGGLKIDNSGNSLLIGLYDQHRKKIE